MGIMSEGPFPTLNAPCPVLCLHSAAVGLYVGQWGWDVAGQGSDRGHGAAPKGMTARIGRDKEFMYIAFAAQV